MSVRYFLQRSLTGLERSASFVLWLGGEARSPS
jgi:hypothetical protein